MVVDSIEPAYYAAGNFQPIFTLKGYNLDLIPTGALAYVAISNDNPTQLINLTSNTYRREIVGHDNKMIQIEFVGSHDYSQPIYLGCIMSADLQSVLWKNETRPLP